MSHLLEQLEGRERRAECLRNEAMTADETRAFLAQFGTARESFARWPRRMRDAAHYGSARAFFAECEAEARDVMRGAA